MMNREALHSVRVFELGRHAGVRAACRLLAESGAEVVRLDSGASDPFLDAGKSIASGNHLPEAAEICSLFASTDVVVTDEIVLREFLPPLEFAEACQEFRRTYPQTLLVVLTAERGGNVSDENSLTEVGARQRAALNAPLVPFTASEEFPFAVATTFCAYYVALAVVLGLVKRRQDGSGSVAEIPLWEAALTAQGLQAVFSGPPIPRWSPLQWLASPFKGIWRAADQKFFYMHIGLTHHLARFLDVLPKFGFEREAKEFRARLHSKTMVDPVAIEGFFEGIFSQKMLRKIFSQKSALEWEIAMGSNSLCAAVIRTYDEWLAHPHALSSGLSQEYVDKGGAVRHLPGRLFQWGVDSMGPLFWAKQVRRDSLVKDWSELSSRLNDSTVATSDDRASAGGSCDAPPLQGLKVLDFSQVIAGPLVGRSLAEFGADVVRIENPTVQQGFIEPFAAGYQAGKGTLTLDLRRPEEMAHLWKFVDAFRPDVVVQNFSPGVAERMGISESDFRKRLPGIVFADLTAFGHGGPLAKQPGFEQTAQALTGMMHDFGRNGEPRMFPLAVNDIGTGLLGTFGVLAAFFSQSQTKGKGRRVHTSLAASATFLQAVTRSLTERGEPGLHPNQNLKKRIKSLVKTGSSALEMRAVAGVGAIPLLRSPVYFSDGRISLAEAEKRVSKRWFSSVAAGSEVPFRFSEVVRFVLRETKWALWLGVTRISGIR